MKHAYLILAHTEFGLLQTLVDCLDDVRNDLFVHIDRKVEQLPDLHARRAGLRLLERRIDIRWGDYSMVEAELALFEAAASQGPYAYYHLLSGVDLPLRSQDEIHAFFEANQGKEFVGYLYLEMTPDLVRRMQRWHLFPRHFSRRRNGYSAVRALCLRVQELLGIKRNRQIEFRKGAQWASITDALVRHLLARRVWIEKTFTHTFVPDECVLQTLVWNSTFRARLYSLASEEEGCLRHIGWVNDELYDWKAADYDQLVACGALFARKFNGTDPAFIGRIAALSVTAPETK